MKEIFIVVRQNKVGQTKEALTQAGAPGFSCRKVVGRGKMSVPANFLSTLEEADVPSSVGESLSESGRLIPKRLFTVFAQDEDVEKIVTAVMDVNSTGEPGDGKIFVLPVFENYRVRDGEMQEGSDSY